MLLFDDSDIDDDDGFDAAVAHESQEVLAEKDKDIAVSIVREQRTVGEDTAVSASKDEAELDKLAKSWPTFQAELASETQNGTFCVDNHDVAVNALARELKRRKQIQDLLVRVYCRKNGYLVSRGEQEISQRMGCSIKEFRILGGMEEKGSFAKGFKKGEEGGFKKGLKKGRPQEEENGFKLFMNCCVVLLILSVLPAVLTFVGTFFLFRCNHSELVSNAQRQPNTVIPVTKKLQSEPSQQKSAPVKNDLSTAPSVTIADLQARVQQWKVSHGKLSSLITVLQKDREDLVGKLDGMGVKSVSDATTDPRSKVLLEEFRDVLTQLVVSQKKRDDYDMAVFKSESQLRRLERRVQGKAAGVTDAAQTDLVKSMLSLEESLSSDSKETVPLALDDELAKELASVREQKSQPKERVK